MYDDVEAWCQGRHERLLTLRNGKGRDRQSLKSYGFHFQCRTVFST